MPRGDIVTRFLCPWPYNVITGLEPDQERREEDEKVSSAKILLVEDEKPMQRALTRILEESNYTVYTADTAEEGVRAALAEHPDVLVLDVNLPDDTGWTVLRQLAAKGITCRTLPTIVLSAGQPAQRRIEEFKPMAFLAKPFPIDALKRLIAEALVSKTTQDTNADRPPGQDSSST